MEGMDFSPLLISVKTAAVATLLAFFFGILAARKVKDLSYRKQSILDGILTLPLVLPPTVIGYLLLLLFSIRRPFGQYLLETFSVQIVLSWPGCVIAAAVVAFPLMYKNAKAAFEQIDFDVIDAARTLGLSEWTIFTKLMLPLAAPGILSGTILTFARALGEYGATSMLAGNIKGKTQTVAVAIASETAAGEYRTAGGWVVIIVTISFGIVTAINLISYHWGKKWRKENGNPCRN